MGKKTVNPTMMGEITINDKAYPLHFGLDFIRSLDRLHYVEREGLTFGTGLIYAMTNLAQRNPVILQEVVLAATCTHKPAPPTAEMVELWLYEQDMEGLCEDFLGYLDKSPATVVYLNRLKQLGADAQASN